MKELIYETASLLEGELSPDGAENKTTVYNPTSFERSDTIYFEYIPGKTLSGAKALQKISKLDGSEKLAAAGIHVLPYSSEVFSYTDGALESPSAFKYENHTLETPFATVIFAENGTISSFIDKSADRELCGEGYPLNTFLIAEDVPSAWDNWDIDADILPKFGDCSELISEKVVSDGAVEFRIRRNYRLTEKSGLVQDMVFSAFTPEVRFETLMDWNDDHRLLKTAFDTDVFSDFVRQEIQFGYLKRPTTRNTSVEQAKFEVLNHKYTDLSESNYGVSILNDCKYGISAYGGQLRLTLHKGGNRPDYTGDHGKHYCEYSFLPHNCGFCASGVIRPAYELNYKPVVLRGAAKIGSLARTTSENVIIETIKPCEDAREKAFILRLYEAEGGRTRTELSLGFVPKAVFLTNMLEEEPEELPVSERVGLTFRPFEIKTIKVTY